MKRKIYLYNNSLLVSETLSFSKSRRIKIYKPVISLFKKIEEGVSIKPWLYHQPKENLVSEIDQNYFQLQT